MTGMAAGFQGGEGSSKSYSEAKGEHEPQGLDWQELWTQDVRAHNPHLKVGNNLGQNGESTTFPKNQQQQENGNDDNLDSPLVSEDQHTGIILKLLLALSASPCLKLCGDPEETGDIRSPHLSKAEDAAVTHLDQTFALGVVLSLQDATLALKVLNVLPSPPPAVCSPSLSHSSSFLFSCPAKNVLEWLHVRKERCSIPLIIFMALRWTRSNSDWQVTVGPDEIPCKRPMLRKFVQSAPSVYSHALSTMIWGRSDGETLTVNKVADRVRQYEDSLSHPPIITATKELAEENDKIFDKLSRMDKRSHSAPEWTRVPASRRRRPPQERRNMPRSALWSALCEYGEDMREWEGQPTSVLQARVQELQDRISRSKSFSRRKVALVSSEWF
ncbi:hypothetical protein llap_13461 [Limosa lapponica baueri]|uniref:Uncharacterized protein n=1 Tax=Limosa lapponica baueri TaxID=1758121 RepID=A0A2I0TR27_LIMLA|nr:hypothetical protein llap_13461 [Limosa lapponica baueri]